MRLLLVLLTLLFVYEANMSFGQSYNSKQRKLKTPPRIIRTCCAFGSDVGVFGIPFLKYTETTSIEKLGEHVYMGAKDEGNGIVYTCRGGFVDTGHLRDQADWTAFLYDLIKNNKGKSIKLKLGREGGVKKLELNIPESFSKNDEILLAGRIAYDLSVWHEISTWYGVSSVPFIPERYSAFSIEDDYSNLLGVTLGMKALKCELPYEQAMTKILITTLDSLKVVDTEDETLEAMEDVNNEWWTREKRLPSRKILIKREITNYKGASPLLIPDKCNFEPMKLDLIQTSSNNEPLSNYYQLDFKVNRKIPNRKIFPNRKGRNISQDDFIFILEEVNEEVKNKFNIDNIRKEKRKARKANRG